MDYHLIIMIDSNKIKKIVGKNVKKLRMAKNITQELLAEYLDFQRETITAIETGRTFISAEALTKLSNYFNVEPNYFFKSQNIDDIDNIKDLKEEINRLMSDCTEENLKYIYRFITVIKN